MKFFTYILLVCLMFMGMDRFMHGMEAAIQTAEISCEMDCCASDDDCEKEKDPSSDHNCPPGCDCDCCFHITAIQYQFISIPTAEVQSYHFGNYSNNYRFEFFIPPFQPPRLT